MGERLRQLTGKHAARQCERLQHRRLQRKRALELVCALHADTAQEREVKLSLNCRIARLQLEIQNPQPLPEGSSDLDHRRLPAVTV